MAIYPVYFFFFHSTWKRTRCSGRIEGGWLYDQFICNKLQQEGGFLKRAISHYIVNQPCLTRCSLRQKVLRQRKSFMNSKCVYALLSSFLGLFLLKRCREKSFVITDIYRVPIHSMLELYTNKIRQGFSGRQRKLPERTEAKTKFKKAFRTRRRNVLSPYSLESIKHFQKQILSTPMHRYKRYGSYITSISLLPLSSMPYPPVISSSCLS